MEILNSKLYVFIRGYEVSLEKISLFNKKINIDLKVEKNNEKVK